MFILYLLRQYIENKLVWSRSYGCEINCIPKQVTYMQLEFKRSTQNVSLLLWHRLNYIISLDSCHNFSARLDSACASMKDNRRIPESKKQRIWLVRQINKIAFRQKFLINNKAVSTFSVTSLVVTWKVWTPDRAKLGKVFILQNVSKLWSEKNELLTKIWFS